MFVQLELEFGEMSREVNEECIHNIEFFAMVKYYIIKINKITLLLTITSISMVMNVYADQQLDSRFIVSRNLCRKVRNSKETSDKRKALVDGKQVYT